MNITAERERHLRELCGNTGADPWAALREALDDLAEARALLGEILEVLDRGGDFQLGPRGRHADLPLRVRDALLRERVDACLDRPGAANRDAYA